MIAQESDAAVHHALASFKQPQTRKEARALATQARGLIAAGEGIIGEALLAVAKACEHLSAGKGRGRPRRVAMCIRRWGAFPVPAEPGDTTQHIQVTPWWAGGQQPPAGPVRLPAPIVNRPVTHHRGQVCGVFIGPQTAWQAIVASELAENRAAIDPVDVQAMIEGHCMGLMVEDGPRNFRGRRARKSRRERGILTPGQGVRVRGHQLLQAAKRAARAQRVEAHFKAKEERLMDEAQAALEAFAALHPEIGGEE